ATIAAALLHDTIEDTAATRAEIDQMFGADIGVLVEGLTKLKKLDLVTREAKQAENLRKLLLAIADDVRVLLVKLAGRLGMHEMREELEDLAFRELNPDAYKVVIERLTALAQRNRDLVSEIEHQLAGKLADQGVV